MSLITGKMITKAYLGGRQVYSAGGTVTYQVDTNVSYTEKVNSGASCLSPTSFVPNKSGWVFIGWREDLKAESTTLTNKIMESGYITLYAVFKKEITVTYYDNTTTSKTVKNNIYYNNGIIVNPSFSLAQASVSGWSARGWSTGTAGNSTIIYNNNDTFTIDSNITLYGTYSSTITLSYNGNSATSGSVASHTGTIYRNYAGTVIGATFTLKSNGFARTGYTFSKWAQGSASGTQYAAGTNVTLTANTTFYAVWTVQKGVLYQNGALTDLGKAHITSLTATKTHQPPAYGAYSTTNYTAIVLNKTLNLKITWETSANIYPQ